MPMPFELGTLPCKLQNQDTGMSTFGANSGFDDADATKDSQATRRGVFEQRQSTVLCRGRGFFSPTPSRAQATEMLCTSTFSLLDADQRGAIGEDHLELWQSLVATAAPQKPPADHRPPPETIFDRAKGDSEGVGLREVLDALDQDTDPTLAENLMSDATRVAKVWYTANAWPRVHVATSKLLLPLVHLALCLAFTLEHVSDAVSLQSATSAAKELLVPAPLNRMMAHAFELLGKGLSAEWYPLIVLMVLAATLVRL